MSNPDKQIDDALERVMLNIALKYGPPCAYGLIKIGDDTMLGKCVQIKLEKHVIRVDNI